MIVTVPSVEQGWSKGNGQTKTTNSINLQRAPPYSKNKLRTECKAVVLLSTVQKSLLYNYFYY